MLTRPYRYWLVAALLAALIYYAWGEITRTRGAQKVSFRPSEEACGTSGSLRYCVYRDRRGTNGDVVYHMHGRNLDERIWNDDTYLTALIQSEWQRRPISADWQERRFRTSSIRRSDTIPPTRFLTLGASFTTAFRLGARARTRDGAGSPV